MSQMMEPFLKQNVLGPEMRKAALEELMTYPYEGTLDVQHGGAEASRKWSVQYVMDPRIEAAAPVTVAGSDWEAVVLSHMAGMIPEPGVYLCSWWFARTPPGAWLDWHHHSGRYAAMYVAQNGGGGAHFLEGEEVILSFVTESDSILMWDACRSHGIPPECSPVGERLVLAANFIPDQGG